MLHLRSVARPGPRALLAILVLVAACGGTSTPPPATVAAPTAAPPATAPPSEGLTPVPGAGGETLGTVVARNIAFEPTAVTAPAGEPFAMTLDNQDSGIPHSLQVNDPNGGAIATSEVITGPAQVNLPVPALEAGSYTFMCTVHPTMTGTLTVE